MLNKKIVVTEIKVYKKTKVWSSVLFCYFNEIIEAVISNHGADLDRAEAIQECWLFLIKLIPKIKLKGNIGAYTYTSLRHYVSDIRENKFKHQMISLEDVKEQGRL